MGRIEHSEGTDGAGGPTGLLWGCVSVLGGLYIVDGWRKGGKVCIYNIFRFLSTPSPFCSSLVGRGWEGRFSKKHKVCLYIYKGIGVWGEGVNRGLFVPLSFLHVGSFMEFFSFFGPAPLPFCEVVV